MEKIKQLFIDVGIETVDLVEKIDVGFSNDVYSVDDTYILKIARRKVDDAFIEKDIRYCRLFDGKFPVPKVLHSGELEDRAYFIYKKIQGDNLYDVWHLSSENKRKGYVEQICKILRVENEFPPDDLGVNWQTFIYSKLVDGIALIEKKAILDKELIADIKSYVESNKDILKAEKITLIDWDLHFDNFIVADGKIVGRLDFERITTASLDYQMVLVKRMVRNPKKYASENAEKFIEVKDYAKLMDWYREFYPEMFDFPDIEKRLNLYAILMCTDDVAIFGGHTGLKEEIEEYLN